jgi:hypothetical protein
MPCTIFYWLQYAISSRWQSYSFVCQEFPTYYYFFFLCPWYLFPKGLRNYAKKSHGATGSGIKVRKSAGKTDRIETLDGYGHALKKEGSFARIRRDLLLLLLLFLITEKDLSVHEKTTGLITMKFSEIIVGTILCYVFVSECQNSKVRFSTYLQGSLLLLLNLPQLL